MDEEALSEFVERARSALEADPGMSARTAEVRVVQPLLSVLGWDVHGTDVVAGYDAGDGTVSFALTVEDEPAILVDAAPPAEDLDADRGRRFLSALRAAGADWGLLTNGREFVFVGGDDEYRRRSVALAELPDSTDVAEKYTTESARQRRQSDRRRRRRAAERLAERRDAVVENLTEELVAAADEDLDDEFRAAAGRFVDRIVAELGESDEGAPTPGGDASPRSGTERDDGDHPVFPVDGDDVPDGAVEHDAETAADPGAEGADGTSTAVESPNGSDDVEPPDSEGDGRNGERGTGGESSVAGATPEAEPGSRDETEYVVRFFDGGTSVGAVGASTPVGALISTVEYLEKQQGVLRRLSLPWETESGTAVLADAADAVAGGRRLPTGHHVATDLERGELRAAIEQLAGSCGLRTMFQGGWE